MRIWKRVGVTILLVVLGAATVFVMSPSRSADTGTIAVESNGVSSPGTASMRAYLDPETGELAVGVTGGDIALDPDTQNALRHDDVGLAAVQHADGSVSIDLDGRYQSVSIIRIDENGKTVICSDNVAGVDRALSESISHPAELEVK